MSSRDPETGQFVSRNNSMSYADHDVQWVRHSARFLNGADSGPTTSIESEEQFEVTARGLDPDELAELRAMRVGVSFDITANPTAQDEFGSFRAQVGSGFNLNGDEYLLATSDLEQVDVDGSGTNDFGVRTRDTDEVGQLFSGRFGGAYGFSDTTDGTGAGAALPSHQETIPVADLFGSGPYLDAADDFTSRIAMNVDNAVSDVACTVVYGLYYNVQQMEGGRTRFGR